MAPASDLLRYVARTDLSIVRIMPKPTMKNVGRYVCRKTNDIEIFLKKGVEDLAEESGIYPSTCSWVFVQNREDLEDEDDEDHGLISFDE